MDKDLKDVLTYFFGTLVGEIVFFSGVYTLIKDIHLTIIYNILAVIIIWLVYLQIKISKKKIEKEEDNTNTKIVKSKKSRREK
ncbi:hypothetical protein J4446_00180 [Candidatus Woesearchaeota archaeon]|nr:hypothetical protein [Candidatus Woesearchaeota archaeon]